MSNANIKAIDLVLVQPRADFAQVAGWLESCGAKYPQVFGMFDGPTFYQGETLTDAIRNAANSETAVSPADWK